MNEAIGIGQRFPIGITYLAYNDSQTNHYSFFNYVFTKLTRSQRLRFLQNIIYTVALHRANIANILVQIWIM